MKQALLRAKELGIADRVSCFQSDLTSSFPLDGQKFDVVIGHFLLYDVEHFPLYTLEPPKTDRKPWRI